MSKQVVPQREVTHAALCMKKGRQASENPPLIPSKLPLRDRLSHNIKYESSTTTQRHNATKTQRHYQTTQARTKTKHTTTHQTTSTHPNPSPELPQTTSGRPVEQVLLRRHSTLPTTSVRRKLKLQKRAPLFPSFGPQHPRRDRTTLDLEGPSASPKGPTNPRPDSSLSIPEGTEQP